MSKRPAGESVPPKRQRVLEAGEAVDPLRVDQICAKWTVPPAAFSFCGSRLVMGSNRKAPIHMV